MEKTKLKSESIDSHVFWVFFKTLLLTHSNIHVTLSVTKESQMKRTAIYLRVSKKKELRLTNQWYAIKRYLEYKQLGDFYIFRDRSTGRNDKRPQYKKLMESIQAHKFDRLIVFKMDRVSRSLRDTLSLIDILEANNTNLISINENFDYSTAMGKAFMHMIATFAQLESDTISERVKNNFQNYKKLGSRKGRKWGPPTVIDYTKVNELRRQGYSARQIARDLNCSNVQISRHIKSNPLLLDNASNPRV